MLDVHRLWLLRELDRRGTLAAVARALSYSPSAVSQQLSQLEAETGVVLLEPAGRGVRLTAQARILVAHAEAILERLEEAEAELRASLTEVRGTLRVASFQSVLLALVPEVLTRLAERHPGLRVEITHQEAGRRSRACSRTTSTSCSARSTRASPGLPSGVPAPSCSGLTSCSSCCPRTARTRGRKPRRRLSTCPISRMSPGSSTRRAPGQGSGRATPAARRASSPTCVTPGPTCCCRSTWPRRGTPRR